MDQTGLRIIIDGSMARGGGGLTYLVNVIPAILEQAPQHTFLLCVDSDTIAQSLPPASNLEIRKSDSSGILKRFHWILLDGPRLAAEWKADLFFSVAEYAPLRAPCPVIAAFRNRAVFTPVEGGWPLKQKIRLGIIRSLAIATARASARIVFVSTDSADYIGRQASIPEQKRKVVHHGINRETWSAPVEKPTELSRYILSVGSIYRYKNYVVLIEGWAELCARNPDTPDLVIIGDDQDPEHAADMEEARLRCGELGKRVHILGEVPYSEILGWYRYAELFVFPSYLETFGHPLLEAMASGIPLVACDIPVFREIAGDGALYAASDDTSAFAKAMEDALFDSEKRSTLLNAGATQIEHFSWNRTAGTLLELFEDTVSQTD